MSITNHPVEQEEIMAYLDGELAPERAAETASHLDHCAQCQRLANDLRDVSETLAAWQVHEEEVELEPSREVAEALKKPSPQPAGTRRGPWLNLLKPHRWPKPVWGLAAIAVIAVVLSVPPLQRSPRFESVMESVPAGAPAPQSGVRRPAKPERMRSGATAGKISAYNNAESFSTADATSSAQLSGYDSLNQLHRTTQEDEEDTQDEKEPSNVPANNGPMIIRTAELEVTTKEFDKARSSVDEILKRRHGYVGELNVNTPTGSARSLNGTLRVPASQLDATLSDLKALGRTEKEAQGGEEVTQQYVDLQARLANAKHTEQRLTDMLRDRTGKLSDVLAVEMQISRVRGEIEQMEAQRKSMRNQVDFATVTVTVTEEYKAKIDAVPPSTGTQFRNAAVEGYRSLVDGIIAVLLWLLSVGPTLLLWIAILFFPARMLWKRLRSHFAPKASEV